MRILLPLTAALLALACSKPLEPEQPALAVTGTVPSQQARNIPVTTDITLSFNQPVTVTKTEAVFVPSLKYPRLGNNSIFISSDRKSFSVNYHEHEHLLPDTTYTVTFSGIEDIFGNILAPYNLIFVTQ